METQATPATTFDASGTARDLCALSDEQILDIAPEPTAPATMNHPSVREGREAEWETMK